VTTTSSRVGPVDALAADGTIVRLRTVAPADGPALRELHAGVSRRNSYLRFFTENPTSADNYARHLTDVDPARDRLILLAEQGGRLVGVGSCEPVGAGAAEVAFLIDDRCHGLGIATLLLEHLAAAARDRGIVALRADVLADNHAMLRVFADSGFTERTTRDGGVTEVVLDTALTALTLTQMAAREQHAESHSLAPLLSPRTVAVIGAGRTPGGIGHEILRNLIEGAFTGRVYPVNPKAARVAGLRAYPTVADVPEQVDLAVLAVPASAVRTVVEECCRAGVRAVVVTTAGFGETGGPGLDAQRELVALARRHGTRLVGPNCLGVVNTAADVRLNATFAPGTTRAGGLSLASQSGAVGIAVLDHATRSGLGVADFVSLGNKADVSGNDLLLHWWREPRTKVIGLYLESFGNPLKFARIARQVCADKPVLVVKGGRSIGGARGGASHTAAAATPDTVLRALFAQSGVLRLDTLPELLDVARVLADQPLPAGRRVAIVGNAGGAGILAADAAEAAGLTVPPLSEGACAALAAIAPSAAVRNPVDLGAGADPAGLAGAVRLVLESGEVDAVLVAVAATRANQAVAGVAAVADVAAAYPGIPVLVVCLGVPGVSTLVAAKGLRLPVFAFPEPAVRALGHAADYAAWRRRPRGTVPLLDGVDLGAARAHAAAFLTDRPEGGWMPTARAADLVRAFGVPLVTTLEANGIREALSAAARLGYPVVLKTAAPGVLHKTDVGAVRVDLRDAAAVRVAHGGIREITGDVRVIVQPMAAGGVEMVVGIVRDPPFGPVVMLGTGGVLTDLLADRAWRGMPLTDLDATEMVGSLRGAALLAGFRGAEPADVPALLDVVHRVALMADQIPEIVELDLNPVIVGTAGAVAVDVGLRLAPAGPSPDPVLRRLS
jgi:acyl-CoA synthetase (NDP forming)/GNAT superfamily N-acetyltransferase